MSELLLHTPVHRWLLRLLPIGAVVAVLAFGVGAWTIIHSIHKQEQTTQLLRAQNQQQNQTIRQLCDNGYIIDDLVQAALQLVTGDPTVPAARRIRFVRQFSELHQVLIAQLTEPPSACVKATAHG